MRNFLLVAVNVDVTPICHDLFQHPELWGQNRFRTTFDGNPHQNVEDILLRYSPPNMSDRTDVYDDVTPVWYPETCSALPNVKPIVLALMARVQACNLGRVMITRIPTGGRILPHVDDEGSYCDQKGLMRYHIVCQGNAGSLFSCGDEVVTMKTGEVWSFRPDIVHEVMNNSNDDRIHLIADMTFWS